MITGRKSSSKSEILIPASYILSRTSWYSVKKCEHKHFAIYEINVKTVTPSCQRAHYNSYENANKKNM